MTIYFSKSNNAFYDSEIHGIKLEGSKVLTNDLIPDDVVEIPKETHVVMLNGQTEGKVIFSDESGWPILVTREGISTLEELKITKKNLVENIRNTDIKGANSAVTDSLGRIWQTDKDTMVTLNNVITTFSDGVPEGYEWRDADNVNHLASLSMLKEIATLRAIVENNIWKASWYLKGIINEATDKQELASVVIPDTLIGFTYEETVDEETLY